MSLERAVSDDLGDVVRLPSAPERIVSLVPSLTESIAETLPEALVGATDWCTHPGDLQVTRVRGTKNPNLPAVIALSPDLVLANKEENRRTDVAALRAAGIAVWVTDIETVDQALVSLRRIFVEALGRVAPPWLNEAETIWRQPTPAFAGTVVIPIWRDPWMVVGRSTFTGDLVGRLGLRNVYEENPDRYPHGELAEIRQLNPDLVMLPDEPYLFTPEDGPEAFPGQRIALVEGRSLTWYGPSLVRAKAVITRQMNAARIYS